MQARRSRTALLACTALAVLALTPDAFAQNASTAVATTGDSTALQPIVVKGKRVVKAGTISDTPLATENTAESLRKNEVTSITDLGNTTEPGVDYSKRTDGAVIRGLTGPRILTTVDGIPIPYLENYARGNTSSLTNSDGGGSSFDFSSISTLDVLRGADSSRAGSGALGGALVLRTLEPEDLIAEGRDWGGLVKSTYDSEDRSISGSLAIAGRSGDTSALFQGSYKRGHETDNRGTVDSYGRSRTEPDPMDFNQNNVLFKMRHQLEGGHTIGFTAERYNRKSDTDLMSSWNVVQGSGPRPLPGGGATPDTRYRFPENGYFGHDETQRERLSLDYSYVAPEADSLIEAANATLYWQRLTKNAGAEGTQVPNLGAPRYYWRDNEISESDFGFTGNMIGSFTTGDLDHELRIGVDIMRFSASQYMELLPASAAAGAQSDIPDVDGSRFGIAVEDRIALADTGFALTPGLRFDWHSYEPKNSDGYQQNPGNNFFTLPDEHSGSRFSPKLLATYQATPTIELFAQWAAAYRAPTVNELYLNFTNPSTGYAQIGNPALKSETGHGIEVGANVGTDDFGGRVTVFNNWYRNFIVAGELTPDPAYPGLPFGIGRFENVDKVRVSGVEVKAHKLFDNGIRVHGALAYAYGLDVKKHVPLSTVAPFKAVIGIGYEQEHWGADLTGIFVGGYRGDGKPATFDAPGYGIANLTGWWEPEQANGLRIQAGIYNVFDKKHFDALGVKDVNLSATSSQPADFYSQPGRTFKVSITQRF